MKKQLVFIALFCCFVSAVQIKLDGEFSLFVMIDTVFISLNIMLAIISLSYFKKFPSMIAVLVLNLLHSFFTLNQRTILLIIYESFPDVIRHYWYLHFGIINTITIALLLYIHRHINIKPTWSNNCFVIMLSCNSLFFLYCYFDRFYGSGYFLEGIRFQLVIGLIDTFIIGAFMINMQQIISREQPTLKTTHSSVSSSL